MNRSHLLALLSLGLLLVTGCHGPCRQLSEKLCECSENSIQKEACLRRVSSEEARIGPTPEQEQVCAGLLEGCDCHKIDTPEGKRACGLAR